MSNFPIEIMVKLTYNIHRGDTMAKFCLECWNKINEREDSPKKYVLTKDLELCEGCGEWKKVIVAERKFYYAYKFRYFIIPFKLVFNVFRFVCRLLILPYLIFRQKNKS